MHDWKYAEHILSLPSVPLGMSHQLPQRPGVYFAVVSDIQGNAFIGYVGVSSTSLRQRWGGHRSLNGKAAKLTALSNMLTLPGGPAYVLIHYAVGVPVRDLLDMEKEIIKIWNPPLNAPRRGEGGTPLLITPNPTGIGSIRDRMPVYVSPMRPAEWSVNCFVAQRKRSA